MPMTPPDAPPSNAGLSAHARDLWRASRRYRLLADALAAGSKVEPGQKPATTNEDDPWPAFR